MVLADRQKPTIFFVRLKEKICLKPANYGAINNHPVLGSLLIPYLAKEVSPGVLEAEEKAAFIEESRLSAVGEKSFTLSQCCAKRSR